MIPSAPGSAGHRLAARFADGPHVSAPIQAELVCGGNQGPRQVQRGDPDQARTGSRGRYAGAPDRPGDRKEPRVPCLIGERIWENRSQR